MSHWRHFLLLVVVLCTSLSAWSQAWDTTGCALRDTLPTAPCGMGIASVDPFSNQIMVWWEASMDSDIAGYYICYGNPCLGLDTVWGKHNTIYICNQLSVEESHQFRVLAFDSCFKASPLTPRFGNLLLRVHLEDCPLGVHASWQGCDSLPGGMGGYRLMASFNGGSERSVATLGPMDHSYRLPVDDTVSMVTLRVAALSTDGIEKAWSNSRSVPIQVFDSSWALSIAQIRYDAESSAVNLHLAAHRGFAGEHFDLYRGVNGRDEMLLTHFYPNQAEWDYQDMDLGPRDTLVSYRLQRVDSCGRVRQSSSKVQVVVPMAPPTAAFFPNIFTPDCSSNNLFKGNYVSVLRQGFVLRIYNRIGLLVFSTADPDEAWDGRFQGNPLPTGTYVYQAYCPQREGGIKRLTGTVLLVR